MEFDESMTKEQYIKFMHFKNRCLIFAGDDTKIHLIMTYAIINNPNNIERNGVWGLPKEDIRGEYILIDRIINKSDEPLTRKEFRANLIKLLEYLKEKYPDKEVVGQQRSGKGEKIFSYSSKLS